jgi:hypothetical protein
MQAIAKLARVRVGKCVGRNGYITSYAGNPWVIYVYTRGDGRLHADKNVVWLR